MDNLYIFFRAYSLGCMVVNTNDASGLIWITFPWTTIRKEKLKAVVGNPHNPVMGRYMHGNITSTSILYQTDEISVGPGTSHLTAPTI